MTTARAGGALAGPLAGPQTWECGACGHSNRPGDTGIAALTCEACGVAKRYWLDPPLDLPSQLSLTAVPGFWFGVGWLLAAIVGGVVWLSPSLTALSGLGRNFVLFEVAAALYAAASSFLDGAWERWFNQVDLAVPDHSATGQPFSATLTLVPYRSLKRVSVNIRLVDRFYEREGTSGVKTSSRVLGSFQMLRSGELRGRRSAIFEAGFTTPFPATKHSDVMAEIGADVLDVVGRFVPALRWNARNLREHGGYIVEATVT
ncbi:MAG TPA: zinc finger Ran-binding domain-containing protein, partial [Trueperaceae bacterium]|nr:zinc finger Ran-binding domain-containing protein [Trueperaceae bacterium]